MPIEFKQATLNNGLQIIAEVDPLAHTSAMGIYVKAGARDEDSEIMGVSHFLEHMMFKGTDNRSADQVNQHFDDIGASYNAFTSHEMTAFYAHVLPEHIERAENILTDILRPSLRQADFDQEKGVILEEIAMYEDSPFWVLYENAMEQYYKSHPLHHRVLGTDDTINKLGREDMQAYFDTRYSADNTVICYAGDIDFDASVERIKTSCNHWLRTGAIREYPALERASGDTVKHNITSEKVNRHYQLSITPAPSIQSDDRQAAAILANILGGGEGSRLYWALIETGLAEEAQAQYDGRDQLGEFYIYASCSPDAATTVEETILTEIEKLVDSITDDDLLRVRSRVATSATLAGEQPAGRMRRLGHVWMYFNEYRSLDDELARINAVTIEDLKRVATNWPLEPTLTATLRPS